MRSDTLVLCRMLVFLIIGVTSANPPPMPKPTPIEWSLVQTLEFALHRETSGESRWSTILYGGPFLMYTYEPADARGLGGGAYFGMEIRYRFLKEPSGPFLGFYIGAGCQLYEDESDDLAFTAAFSMGPKIGWRIPLVRGWTDIDIEPYTCIGFQGGGSGTGLGVYLGLKLDFII